MGSTILALEIFFDICIEQPGVNIQKRFEEEMSRLGNPVLTGCSNTTFLPLALEIPFKAHFFAMSRQKKLCAPFVARYCDGGKNGVSTSKGAPLGRS